MRKILAALLLVGLLCAGSAVAQEQSADKILADMDALLNKFEDLSFRSNFKVIDANGKEKVSEMLVWQKGGKRMVKFIKPASDKGMAILSDDQYTNFVYLPAYKKVRRIASHIRNQTFMGSDFTQEDIGTTRYGTDFDAKILSQDDGFWTLDLTPKADSKTHYGKLHLKVHKQQYTLHRIDYFDKTGEKIKFEQRNDFKQYDGKYWNMSTIVMTGVKEKHETRLLNTEIKYDQGLTDDFFSQRNLKRPVR